MNETAFYKKVKKRLDKEFGGFWFKVHGGPFQRKGLPDIIGCVRGKFIGIELKVPGNTPTALQRDTIKRIKKNKGLAFWSDDVEDIIDTVRHHLERRKKNAAYSNNKRHRT